MSAPSVEERLTALEKEIIQLKQQLTTKSSAPSHPWDKVFGSFAHSEGFDEAVQLGREYRESLRPKDNKDTA